MNKQHYKNKSVHYYNEIMKTISFSNSNKNVNYLTLSQREAVVAFMKAEKELILSKLVSLLMLIDNNNKLYIKGLTDEKINNQDILSYLCEEVIFHYRRKNNGKKQEYQSDKVIYVDKNKYYDIQKESEECVLAYHIRPRGKGYHYLKTFLKIAAFLFCLYIPKIGISMLLYFFPSTDGLLVATLNIMWIMWVIGNLTSFVMRIIGHNGKGTLFNKKFKKKS